MTDQPTPGRDDTPHGGQPPSYTQPHGTEGAAPAAGQGSEPDYGRHRDQPYGQGSSAIGQPASPYGSAYGNQYGASGQYGGYNAYGQPEHQYGAPGQYGGYNYGAPAEPKALSIASLCCGIAALVGFGFFLLPQIAAVILGHMALAREPAGRGMAIAGLVLGYVGIALTILVIVILGILVSSASFGGYPV